MPFGLEQRLFGHGLHRKQVVLRLRWCQFLTNAGQVQLLGDGVRPTLTTCTKPNPPADEVGPSDDDDTIAPQVPLPIARSFTKWLMSTAFLLGFLEEQHPMRGERAASASQFAKRVPSGSILVCIEHAGHMTACARRATGNDD